MDKPLRPCSHPGCTTLTTNSYCAIHKPKEQPRQSSYQRGYTSKWRTASKGYLSHHPWCVECEKKNIHEPATETDHIIPHKGDVKLFWDKDNWQGLCHSCHSSKTAREDGGFRNGKRKQSNSSKRVY